jgi:outer membrane protein OmpA-like peptidoglycan-associated protein
MKISHYILFGMALTFILTGCSSKNVFVLLQDQEGKVGNIEIVNDQGSSNLNKLDDTAEVDDSKSAPRTVPPMNTKKIYSTFGTALAVEPPQPRIFLLYFQSETDLTEESVALLPEIIKSIKTKDSRHVSVIGHADRAGSTEENVILSTSRAASVRDQIVQMGIQPALIDVTSYGEGNPIIPTEDGVAEPKNRRVEIIVR